MPKAKSVPSFFRSHCLINNVPNGVCRLPPHPLCGVGVGVQREARTVVAQRVGEGFHIYLGEIKPECMPDWAKEALAKIKQQEKEKKQQNREER